MTSVWKRLQRAGKKASKFQFAASFHELMIECTDKWQPDKLRVSWIRRTRRHSTKLHSWQPGIKNPYRGLVLWQVPESLDISVTLFKEPTADEFEDKDWTFVIENETKGRRKVLASADVNMKKFASATPAQYDVTLKLKPLSVKVVEATLKLNLSCVFLKEGKATDDDMQSLASLLSMKQSDIGNLDDFIDSDDEGGEERRASFGQATHVTEFKRQLSTLREEDHQCMTSAPDATAPASRRPEPPRASDRGRDPHAGMHVVKASAGPESMASLLPLSPRKPVVQGLKYFEMPKPQVNQSESRPTRTFPSIQPTVLPFTSAHRLNCDYQECSSASVKGPLVQPRSHLSMKSIQLGNARPEPNHHISPSNSKPTPRPLQGPLQIATGSDTKPIETMGAACKKEAVTVDLGNESIAGQSGECSIVKNSHWEKPQRDIQTISPTVPIPIMEKKTRCNMTASVNSRLDPFGVLSAQQVTADNLSNEEEFKVDFASSSTKRLDVHDFDPQHCMGKVRTKIVAKSAGSTEEMCLYLSTAEHSQLCTTKSYISQSPSILQPDVTLCLPRMIKLQSSCPQYSKIHGMPSLYQSEITAWPDWRLLTPKLPSNRFPLLLHSDFSSLFKSSAGILKMVDITPSCPRSASIPGFPSALKREPNMTCLLPICPRICSIPGLASAGAVNVFEDYVLDNGSLWRKQLQIKDAFISYMSCFQEQDVPDTNMVNSMVAMLPTCSRKASIPGFPSAPLLKVPSIPNMASLLPTYPKQTIVAGMPGRQEAMAANDSWLILREYIFERPLRSNPALVSHEDKEHIRHMVDMLLSCPCKEVLPGFPSVPRKGTDTPKEMLDMLRSCPHKANVFGSPSAPQKPSMVNIMPLCPVHSKVPGCPSQTGQKLCVSSCNEWFASKILQWDIPFIKKEVQIRNAVSCFDENTAKSMSAILPSCPEKVRVPGFPSALTLTLTNVPTMVNLLPSCTKASRIPGMPLRDTSEQSEWLMASKSLLRPREKLAFEYNLLDVNVFYSDCDCVSILPSCPQTARLPGFQSVLSTVLADIPSMINSLPTCPRHSTVCGIPSRYYGYCDEAEWHVYKWPVWERPLTNQGKMPVIHDHTMHITDKVVVKIMVSMLPPCPQHSSIPGISEAGEKPVEAVMREAQTMLKTEATFPQQREIPGLHGQSSAKDWDGRYVDKDVVWKSSFNTVKDPSYRDKEITQSMLKSCHSRSLNPGTPPAYKQQVLDATLMEKHHGKNMVKLLPCCPQRSSIVGFPSRLSVISDSEVSRCGSRWTPKCRDRRQDGLQKV